jgi:hypothetical protein
MAMRKATLERAKAACVSLLDDPIDGVEESTYESMQEILYSLKHTEWDSLQDMTRTISCPVIRAHMTNEQCWGACLVYCGWESDEVEDVQGCDCHTRMFSMAKAWKMVNDAMGRRNRI